MYLHSVVIFILLRYKQDLLEARGFERSTLSSQRLGGYRPTENELAFSRALAITGYVRHYWPKSVNGRIESVSSGLTMGKIDSVGTVVELEEDQMWNTEEDMFSPHRIR
jgi:hypothetical protein